MDETDVSLGTTDGKRNVVGPKGKGAPATKGLRSGSHVTAVSANTASGLNLRPFIIAPSSAAVPVTSTAMIEGNDGRGPVGTAPVLQGAGIG